MVGKVSRAGRELWSFKVSTGNGDVEVRHVTAMLVRGLEADEVEGGQRLPGSGRKFMKPSRVRKHPKHRLARKIWYSEKDRVGR